MSEDLEDTIDSLRVIIQRRGCNIQQGDVLAAERAISTIESLVKQRDAAMEYGHKHRLATAIARSEEANVPGVWVETMQSALAYINHVGSNWTMRGEPHPQQWLVTVMTDLLEQHKRVPQQRDDK